MIGHFPHRGNLDERDILGRFIPLNDLGVDFGFLFFRGIAYPGAYESFQRQ